MRITQQTIQALEEKGIKVSFHPESDEEYRKKVWEENYRHFLDYYNGGKVFIDGKVIHFDAKGEYEQSKAREYADRRIPYIVKDWYNAETLYIRYGDKGRMVVQKVSVKSKEITEDYVMKLIEKNEKSYNGIYGNFADKMNKLIAGRTSQLSIYPTTYGIGVWIFYNFKAEENITYVENILKEKGIEYYNEFSDAHYVYRFKISKKKENLERI